MALSAENDSIGAVAGNAFGGLNNFSVNRANARQRSKARMPALVLFVMVFKIYILVVRV